MSRIGIPLCDKTLLCSDFSGDCWFSFFLDTASILLLEHILSEFLQLGINVDRGEPGVLEYLDNIFEKYTVNLSADYLKKQFYYGLL